MSSYGPQDEAMLRSHGWRVRHALDFSMDPDAYRQYVAGSRSFAGLTATPRPSPVGQVPFDLS